MGVDEAEESDGEGVAIARLTGSCPKLSRLNRTESG